uniref:Uncharacterized protein n=1 Tax=Timema genevievae TaxID=629358 RepID=A0A7R9PS72_TIMGE|nr:unnamed protein product [Timema genevievae]
MLLTVMLFLGSAIHLTTSQPTSPCPSVFQYQLDEKGIWSGMVLVPPVPSNAQLKVNVEMFVRASLPTDWDGALEFFCLFIGVGRSSLGMGKNTEHEALIMAT